VLQCVLEFVTERNITLTKYAYSKPPITIKSHDLHACDIRGAMGEIVSYHKKGFTFSLFGSYKLHIFWPLFGLCLSCEGSDHRIFYWIFLPSFINRCVFFQFFEIGVGGNHPKVDLVFIDDKF